LCAGVVGEFGKGLPREMFCGEEKGECAKNMEQKGGRRGREDLNLCGAGFAEVGRKEPGKESTPKGAHKKTSFDCL